ncbi:MAG TPA: acetylornithine deacetylase/succinyl-diaminopimelate desuccinylase family protein [Bryobacteraceae bacterium]
MPARQVASKVLRQVTEIVPEMAAFLQEITRLPTINPPGECYADFVEVCGRYYQQAGYRVEKIVADRHPDHSSKHPRINLLARREGSGQAPCVHFNGHLDVVPVGEGWTKDPFGGEISDGRLYGRGTSDMKAGIAASLFAMEAIRRAGVTLPGPVEQSATVDEESGGFAGVAYLAEQGYLHPGRQQHVIITEPHGPDRVCLGHRGVWWFDVIVHGHIAHGSMPFNGVNAVDRMAVFLTAVNERLRPKLVERVTAMPVAPGEARHPTLNVNSIFAGQALDQRQTPCVPDRCTAVFDRRFLPEEDLAEVKREFAELLAELGLPHEMRDRMTVLPTFTPESSPVSRAVAGAIREVCGKPAEFMASPGTYDQKHFVRIAKVDDCISYGPGVLEMAHQPDEYVSLDDMEASAKVMALATLELMGVL